MIDHTLLKPFALLDSLSRVGLDRAAANLLVRDLAPGDALFHKGDRDPLIHFLLDGCVALRSEDDSAPIVIAAGSEAAQLPLSRLKPRRYTCVAATAARVAAIDEDLLDQLLTADQTAGYEVSLIEGEDPEWMFRLFTSPALSKVPADNLAALFGRLQPVEAKAGQVIVRQGEPGDYYYLIRRGRARVERLSGDGNPVPVAELGVGDAFGEEALLSGEPRNASVTMIEDGQLMRLSSADFNQLLKPALVHRVGPHEALAMIRAGAKFIDVRTEAEYREHTLPGSIKLPLGDLRRLAEGLRRDTRYITVCRTGRRCTAAAFLLSQRGFEVYVLRDGLDAVAPDD
jgi:CRP-like cAMP-binding protein